MPIIAAPFQPPPPPLTAVVSMSGLAEQRWTAQDGTTWVLTGNRSGVRLARGVRGLHFPPTERYSSTSPALAGSRSRGHRTADRDVFWAVHIYNAGGSQAWLDYDAAFWASMRPGSSGVWAVVQPNGLTRSLRCTPTHSGDYAFDFDPSQVGWNTYPVNMLAEQPFWEAAPLVRSWKASPPVSFFGAGAPPFSISSGSAFETATVDNPGDVESFPTWTLYGPITSADIGVDSHVFEYAQPIPQGEYRVIDTRPDHLTVVDQDGTDRLADLGQAEFVPVPAGSSVPLSLSVVGTGTVTMSLTPLYQRAW